MKVFKFGGASVKNAEAIKNVAAILAKYRGESIVVIVSAMGKTTNALEGITQSYYEGKPDLQEKYEALKTQHLAIVEELFGSADVPVMGQLLDLFQKIDSRLSQPPMGDYNFIYDQIVSCGELLSTMLVAAYLIHIDIPAEWMDVRYLLRTDNTYREGIVDWDYSRKQIQKYIPLKIENRFIVTQGFLGGTKEYLTTTLGREGSDYTAAIFANILEAESMTVWKDVPGILSGDPRIIDNPTLIEQLSYYEAVEMTYYGAKVIHPKTIKPLQNRNIPLRVRSFKEPDKNGTIIHKESQADLPPVVVFNKKQLQLSFVTKDYSYIVEENLSKIYSVLAKYRIKTNLSQNGSISFRICIDDVPYKNEPMIVDLANDFEIIKEEGLELITIRHYTPAAIEEFTKDKTILLAQKGRENIQLVVR